ncbi:PQQ-dependent catabolism-associated CXXCW motif protein [Halomonas sp. A29]|uniref:PQQ-dependent catabolism-associated CXXCW motif protein n=1 Tax=Halomonas sp. A29 TaxID=3102786 RepID=UPI00398B23B3
MKVAHRYLAALLLAALWPASVHAATALDDPRLFSERGYRIDRYRSPTPASAPGAITVDTAQVEALLNAQPPVLVVDVINLTFLHGRFLQTNPHRSLPGALWLPNTGLGHLDDDWYYSRHDWVGYLLGEISAASGGDMSYPVLVLCRADCWLSWNAVKRLAEAGFQRLYWYRDGIDSWEAAGKSLEIVSPRPPPFADLDPPETH